MLFADGVVSIQNIDGIITLRWHNAIYVFCQRFPRHPQIGFSLGNETGRPNDGSGKENGC